MGQLEDNEIKQLANKLFNSWQNKNAIIPISESGPKLTTDDAYSIQEELVKLRVENGDIPAGYKMGLTNIVKMHDNNVTEPIYGVLFKNMILMGEDIDLPISKLIHPKLECEIAFKFSHQLSGPNITQEDVLNATEYIAPAFEIVDSRYKDFKFSFNDGIADNICAGMVVLGNKVSCHAGINLNDIGVELDLNGKIVMLGNTSIVLGNTLNSIISLVKILSKKGRHLESGSVVISGMITDAITIKTGDRVKATFEGIGSIAANVV